jgi:hypothetical protein
MLNDCGMYPMAFSKWEGKRLQLSTEQVIGSRNIGKLAFVTAN